MLKLTKRNVWPFSKLTSFSGDFLRQVPMFLPRRGTLQRQQLMVEMVEKGNTQYYKKEDLTFVLAWVVWNSDDTDPCYPDNSPKLSYLLKIIVCKQVSFKLQAFVYQVTSLSILQKLPTIYLFLQRNCYKPPHLSFYTLLAPILYLTVDSSKAG